MIVELNDREANIITVAMAIASSLSLLTQSDIDPTSKQEVKKFIQNQALLVFDKLMDSCSDEEHTAMLAKFPDVDMAAILTGSN